MFISNSKICLVRHYLKFIVGGSCLNYVIWPSDVKHILWCIDCCLSSCCVLYVQCCKYLWTVHLWSHLRYSLTFNSTHKFLGKRMHIVYERSFWSFRSTMYFLPFCGQMCSPTISSVSSVLFWFFTKHTSICFGKIRLSWLTLSLI